MTTQLPANPRWPQFIGWSCAWHAAMAAGAAVTPQHWPLWLGGAALNHGVLMTASMLPRSPLLGPNITRLPEPSRRRGEICLSFDDGPDPATTPAVLALLEEAGARASFFCIGDQLARHPALARRIVEAGHSIENHTQKHHHSFAFRPASGLRAEIIAAQKLIEQTVGVAPVFFRAPAGMRNPFLQTVLADLDLRLASWTRRGFDTVERQPARVLQRLERNLSAGDLLLLHDGHSARDSSQQAVILTVLPSLLQAIASQNLKAVSLPWAFR